jgi:hypothetical protein
MMLILKTSSHSILDLSRPHGQHTFSQKRRYGWENIWRKVLHINHLSNPSSNMFWNEICGQVEQTILPKIKMAMLGLNEIINHMQLMILGRFRTSTKTITNTSSLCGYCRPNPDVISRHFVQTSSWRSKRTWFCWFASICGHFPLGNAIPFDYLKIIYDLFVIVIVFVLVRNLPIVSFFQNSYVVVKVSYPKLIKLELPVKTRRWFFL